MREEHAPPQQDMWLMARKPFEALEHGCIDASRAELVDELIVVDRELLAVRRD